MRYLWTTSLSLGFKSVRAALIYFNRPNRRKCFPFRIFAINASVTEIAHLFALLLLPNRVLYDWWVHSFVPSQKVMCFQSSWWTDTFCEWKKCIITAKCRYFCECSIKLWATWSLSSDWMQNNKAILESEQRNQLSWMYACVTVYYLVAFRGQTCNVRRTIH